jgi:hypothetical protein
LALALVVWPDAELLRIEIDYDELTMHVRDGRGRMKRVTYGGHLGFERTGVWDEVIVTAAEPTASGAFLDRCLSSIARRPGPSPLPTGSAARNREQAMQLVLTLHHQCTLAVVTKGIGVEALD